MTVVRPFRSRVVRQDWAARVVTPMFDAARGAGVGEAFRSTTPDAYAESPPALFVYRLRRDGEEHVGVVCDVRAEAFVNGQVRGHESVQPDRVEALLRHFALAPARSELVALLHHDGPVLARTVAATCRTEPVVRFTGPDDLEQTVWRVPAGPETTALSVELSEAVHYIADGHHRVAASLQEWRLAGSPAEAGVLCVVYPMDGLRMSSFHRRVAGPVDAGRLRAALADDFEVRPVAEPAEATGCFALYVDGRWADVTFTGLRPAGARGLDVAILHDRVLGPLLADRPPGEKSLEIVPAHIPLAELAMRCDADAGAVFALRPPSLEELTGIADRGEVMPPKTTYFEPKPYAGIFLR
ncbi:MAG: DUF1015 family protein [Nocardioidaceae bacterium]